MLLLLLWRKRLTREIWRTGWILLGWLLLLLWGGAALLSRGHVVLAAVGRARRPGARRARLASLLAAGAAAVGVILVHL